MSQVGWEFSGLLTQGVFQVRTLESKPLRTIQDELGYALNKKGGASIEYWRKGHVPSKLGDLEKLGSELVKRGRLDRPWLEKFLHKGGHPAAQQICDELFPPLIYELNANQGNFRLPESYVPEPAPSLPSGSVMPLNRYHNFTGRLGWLKGVCSRRGRS